MTQKIPSTTLHKEVGKIISASLIGGKRKVEILAQIEKELDAATISTSDPAVIQMLREQRLATGETLAHAADLPPGEAKKAQEEHVELAGEIAATQGVIESGSNPAARGVSELSAGTTGGKEEKAASRDTTMSADTKKPVRGNGK
jgi:hypothetical protein